MSRIYASVAGAVLALGIAGTGGAIANASPQAVQACVSFANAPDGANDAYVGRSGCSNTISSYGKVVEDRNGWPDDTVGVKNFNAGTAWIYGSCGNGVGSYYGEFKASGGSRITSGRVTRCG